MGACSQPFKCTVAALLVAVWFSVPVHAQESAVDRIFDELAEGVPEDFSRLQSELMAEWSKSGSATVDLLVQRGQEAIGVGDYVLAVEHFTAAIDHDPAFAEAYNGRATAYFYLNQFGPAIDDIRETLVLNPRHFGAMMGFAAILEQLERPDEALEVYHQIKGLVPAAPNVQEAIDNLELQVNGRTL